MLNVEQKIDRSKRRKRKSNKNKSISSVLESTTAELNGFDIGFDQISREKTEIKIVYRSKDLDELTLIQNQAFLREHIDRFRHDLIISFGAIPVEVYHGICFSKIIFDKYDTDVMKELHHYCQIYQFSLT